MNTRKTFLIRTVSIALALSMLLALFVQPAFALDLGTAKSQKLVGEKLNGYLGAVKQPVSGSVAALVQSINSKRRQRYQQIAQQNGTSVAAVEALAGKKAIGRTPAGQIVESSPGSWAVK